MTKASKPKTAYICNECGSLHHKWSGKCNECNAWNSLAAEVAEGGSASFSYSVPVGDAMAVEMSSFTNNGGVSAELWRIKSGMDEFDNVLGGGIVPGAAILLGGDPGIGKSTLLLQIASSLAASGEDVVYISGEESVDQVMMRARRLMPDGETIAAIPTLHIAAGASVPRIIAAVRAMPKMPKMIVIDSVQTMFIPEIPSAPGTVSQLRATSSELITLAKENAIAMFLVGHVTKDGQIAGPKLLEHMVDTVLYFEGEQHQYYRILRAVKNRFGPSGEIGVFEMDELGLRPVSDVAGIFLSSTDPLLASGIAIFPAMQGSRPVLVEVQSLLAQSYMPAPRRSVVGADLNRLSMLLAVLAARLGVKLGEKEVYLNIAGGLKVNEPALDLAIVMSLISAARSISLPRDMCFFGEVGLSGEVRRVDALKSRLKEATRLGFKTIVLPSSALITNSSNSLSAADIITQYREHGVTLIPISHSKELLGLV